MWLHASIYNYVSFELHLSYYEYRGKMLSFKLVNSVLQLNASRTVFSLEGHVDILQDAACQVQYCMVQVLRCIHCILLPR